jgi:deazaflavin-dependent oxidoreductase (nitroreductase family)
MVGADAGADHGHSVDQTGRATRSEISLSGALCAASEVPVFAAAEVPVRAAAELRLATRAHAAMYRRSGGSRGKTFRKAPVLLLTCRGRKSGVERTVPLIYLQDGDRLGVVASYGGDDRSPAWFLNVVANPGVTVELGGLERRMVATVADAETKARLWPLFVSLYPAYETYRQRTARDLPVVLLSEANGHQ